MNGWLQRFEPTPGVVYTLEVAAALAGVQRRQLLLYCRHGLVRPVMLPPYDIMAFDDEAIAAIRRAELLRRTLEINQVAAVMIVRLLHELQRARAELAFLRQR